MLYPSFYNKFDMIKELNEINKENRKYYDFYRDIKKTKDNYLQNFSNKSENGEINLSETYFN